MAGHEDQPPYQSERGQLEAIRQLLAEHASVYWIMTIASSLAAVLEANGSTNIIRADKEIILWLIPLLSAAISILNTGELEQNPTHLEELKLDNSDIAAVGRARMTAGVSGKKPHSSTQSQKRATVFVQSSRQEYQTGD